MVIILFRADRLIELRKKKNLYQKDIANHFGIERTAYGKYENKGIQPPPDMIVKLADFFDVTTDYLLGKSDDPKHTDLTQDKNELEKLKRELQIRQIELDTANAKLNAVIAENEKLKEALRQEELLDLQEMLELHGTEPAQT